MRRFLHTFTCLWSVFTRIHIIIIIISIQPEGRLWQEPESSQATGMALAHCILRSFLGVGCHCFPPPLDVPTFASRCLHLQATWETSISERRNYGREMAGQFCLWFRLPRKPRVLWHAAQICDMGDGFTSPLAKQIFKKKFNFFQPKIGIKLKKKRANRYLWRIALYCAETWTHCTVNQKYLVSFEMWWWRRM